MAPLIGISAYREVASFGTWNLDSVVLPASYVEAVNRSGGIPVLLPPLPGREVTLLQRLDGLILAGGADIDPLLYQAERHEKTGSPRADRDLFEANLLLAGLEKKIPILAICRGHQLVNVVRGGTLHQHLADLVGSDLHDPIRGGFGSHEISVTQGTKTAAVIGGQTRSVLSHHHQGIAKLGSRLIVSAVSDDGVIEAIEDPELDHLLSVQWHPEADGDPLIFDWLVAQANSFAKAAQQGQKLPPMGPLEG